MLTRPRVEEASNEKIGLFLGGNRFGVDSGNQFHVRSNDDTRSQSTRTGELAFSLPALPAGLSLLLDYQRPFKIQTLPRLRLARSTPIRSPKAREGFGRLTAGQQGSDSIDRRSSRSEGGTTGIEF
jgi:hypothetical protein